MRVHHLLLTQGNVAMLPRHNEVYRHLTHHLQLLSGACVQHHSVQL